MSTPLQRGSVHWVVLDPTVGAEIAKTRPCVILTSNEIIKRRNTVVVIPLTSTPELARFPLLVAVPSAGQSSKARTEHIRSVDKSRIGQRLGRISETDMHHIERGVARVLGLG